MNPAELADHLVMLTSNTAVIALLIIVMALIVEDATTLATALLVSGGHIGLWVAITALAVGVLLGDLGLYATGWLAKRWAPARHRLSGVRLDRVRAWLEGRMIPAMLIARPIPGLRLPTYTAIGFFGLPFRTFALVAGLGVGIWTAVLFTVGLAAGAALDDLPVFWRWLGSAGLIALGIVLPMVLRLWQQRFVQS